MAVTPPSRCAVCGSTQFCLDRNNILRCAVCRTSPHRTADLEQQRSYDNTKRLAAGHIRCGRYSQAISHLNQLQNTNPDDPDVYYLHLMGLTNFLSDLLVPGDDRLSQAIPHYRAYRALGGRNDQFLRYYRRRLQALEELLRHHTRTMWLGILVRLGIAGGVYALLKDSWLLWAAGLLAFVCLVGSSAAHEDPLGTQRVLRLRRQLDTARRSPDPFFPASEKEGSR